jgi:hypothetical protein
MRNQYTVLYTYYTDLNLIVMMDGSISNLNLILKSGLNKARNFVNFLDTGILYSFDSVHVFYLNL